MAARTNTSIGMGILVGVLGTATLGLFITSLLFYAQRRAAITHSEEVDRTSKEFVSDADRNDPVVALIKDAANKSHVTVLHQLLGERKEIMQKATGSDRDTAKTISDAVEKANASSLIGALRDRESEIDSLKKQLADANTARTRAQEDQLNESNRVKAIEESQKATVATLVADVDKTKQEADTLREEVGKARADMEGRVSRIRDDYAAKEQSLKADIDKLQAQAAIDRARIRDFQNQIKGQRYTGQPEYALIDGQIISSNAVEGTVTLNIGRKQKVVLGIPFNVYAQGTTIRADEKTGEYPPGKAAVEVIRVDEDSSVARVLRQQKGNPVIKGDVIANPVFDPAKKYKFLVYGNFDPDHTGTASIFGANEIKAWIKDWGGDTTDEVSGDLDFIVLGERPQLPPQPSGTAPLEVINFYLNQQKLANRYDELLKQASDTSIPLLNENRLRTLIGR